MNWTIKAHLMALLSRAPFGKSVYHGLQRLAGTNRLHPREGISRAAEIVEMAQEAGVAVAGKQCLEIGTGWRPYLPFVLQLVGGARTRSLDVNPWLTLGYAQETLRAIGNQVPELSTRLGVCAKDVQLRLDKASKCSHSLGQLLESLGIEYMCPGDARCTGLADQSVDLICSSNVLEHVKRADLQAIHQESYRLLRPGGVAVHRFNPADHFSFVDKRLTSVNFLQYSEAEWYWLGGSGLSFHNRLRCTQHLELVKSGGFEIAMARERVDQRALQLLRAGEVRLHSDYHHFSMEDLAAEYVWVVARKPL